MMLQPARAEDIADACEALARLADVPGKIAEGLAAHDPDAMRNAVIYLIGQNRTQGIREIVDRFRATPDLGVFARVQSSRLHQIEGDYAAALADLEDVTTRFPERAAPFWWIGRARCLFELGRPDEAQAVAREGAARFPDNAQAQAHVAVLLGLSAQWGEALAAWDDIFARFAGIETSEMFVGRAKALLHLDRVDEAQTVAREGAARFPNDAKAAVFVARLLGRLNRWPEALAQWRALRARGEPEAAQGEAHALSHLGRVEEALALLGARVAEVPDDVGAWREIAHISWRIGDAERSLATLSVLFGRFPGAASPAWWAELARARHDLKDFEGGAAALAELDRRFPKSPLAERERLHALRDREFGHDALVERLAAARKRFPDEPEFRAQWVTILLSYGRLEEAEREVEELEAMKAPGAAISTRLRVEADRGETALRACAAGLKARVATAADAVAATSELFTVRTPWAFDLSGELLEAEARQNPHDLRVRLFLATIRIAQRRDDDALALIDALPAAYRRYEFQQLRAWAAGRRGRHDEAKAIWRDILAHSHFAAVNGPLGELRRLSPNDRPPPGEGVTAYVVLRNEAAMIPAFLAYHRRLGVRRFVFFDNRSTDESQALALAEPDVILYECSASYQLSSSGRRWVNEIVAREGAQGWGLSLDIDEHLIYPGCERIGIDKFVSYLDAHGYEAVRGYMLDVFPQRLLGADGRPAPLADYRFYDDDYYLFGWERPPYLQPGGGVRARLFEAKEYLHKTPLWRLDAGVILSSHETTHLRLADVSTALAHYKLFNIALRGRQATPELAGEMFLEADSNVDCVRRHARYAARLDRLWTADLLAPGVSRELGNSLDMAARGLMDASPAYLDWLGA
jgi:tetratricopeptide (TPR) repeat protein